MLQWYTNKTTKCSIWNRFNSITISKKALALDRLLLGLHLQFTAALTSASIMLPQTIHQQLHAILWSPATKMTPIISVSLCDYTRAWTPGDRGGDHVRWSAWPIKYGRNDGMALLRLAYKRHCLCCSSSLSEHCSVGSQLPYCEHSEKRPTWQGTEASHQQQWVWKQILQPSQAFKHFDCNLMRDLEHQKPSRKLTPKFLTLRNCKIINICCCKLHILATFVKRYIKLMHSLDWQHLPVWIVPFLLQCRWTETIVSPKIKLGRPILWPRE